MLIAASLMAAAAAGAWLKYSTGAVIAAYEVGRKAEAIRQRHARARHAPGARDLLAGAYEDEDGRLWLP